MKTIIIDGVEYDLTPKALFKKGDWIYHEISGNTFHINKIGNGLYVSDEGATISLGRQNDWRLWAIQDAKDGDVLYTSSTASNEVFIFKGLSKEGHIECYCSYDSEDKYCDGKYHFIGKPTFMTHPATKEKRELLFQKIVKKGYIWDPEKKELKKIEQKSAKWSEEDERIFILCASSVKTRYNDGLLTYNEYEQASLWLKAIKERYTWKPSDKQIEVLYKYAEQNNHDGSVLTSLYRDLKKLM